MPAPSRTPINRPVFFIPLAVLSAALLLSLWQGAAFVAVETAINDWVLKQLGPVFAVAGVAFLALLAIVALSPLGKVVIGGAGAQPLLGRWRWFAVMLCTTIATGVLFWGAAEPLFHLNAPPPMLGLRPGSDEAATFAMSTMFLHWTLTPYAIYTVAALAFALVYYNRREPFSLSSLFVPLLGQRAHGPVGTAIDIICLYALVAGMAASLGAGILALAGGIEGLGGFSGGAPLRWSIAALIVASFLISAATGLQKGIAGLSVLNTWIFFLIIAFVFIAGPTAAMFDVALRGTFDHFQTFLPRNLGVDVDTDWHRQWTIFNWANWFAWAPVTALFLGRLAVGYTVRAFILFNLILPALFGAVWMTAIAGATIVLDQQSAGGLYAILAAEGPDPVLFRLFEALGRRIIRHRDGAVRHLPVLCRGRRRQCLGNERAVDARHLARSPRGADRGSGRVGRDRRIGRNHARRVGRHRRHPHDVGARRLPRIVRDYRRRAIAGCHGGTGTTRGRPRHILRASSGRYQIRVRSSGFR